MLYYLFMSDMTNPGKVNANLNPFKVDFSDLEVMFELSPMLDEFGTVILARNNNFCK